MHRTILLLTLGILNSFMLCPAQEKAALFPFRQDDKWGAIDKTGKVIVEPRYTRLELSKNGIVIAVKDKRYGYLNSKGRFVDLGLPGGYSYSTFSEGYAAVSFKHRYGYIDEKGEVIIQPRYVYAGNFSNGIARIMTEEGTAYINKNGTLLTRFYQDGFDFSEGLAYVKIDDEWSFIDTNDKIVIKSVAGAGDGFSEGLASFKQNGKRGFIDKKGKVVIAPRFDQTTPFSEGVASVDINGIDGYIDKKGKMVIEPRFRIAHPFSEGLAAVQRGGKWGYIDKKGKMVIEPRFDEPRPFTGGLAMVIFGQCEYVSRSPKIYEPCRFGYIDKSGRYVRTPAT